MAEYIPGVDDRGWEVELFASSMQGVQHLRKVVISHSCQLAIDETLPQFRLLVTIKSEEQLMNFLSNLSSLLDQCSDLTLVETRKRAVGQGLQVRDLGPFHLCQEGEATLTNIIVQSGNSFGSGAHPSTQLVVKAMTKVAPLQGRALDVGCGSGILAIIAVRLGACGVVGVDICQESLAVAKHNTLLNGLSAQIALSLSPLDKIAGKFDYILANLTGSVLYRLAPDIIKKAKADTKLIISGLQGRQINEALDLLKNGGDWQQIAVFQQDNWYAAVLEYGRADTGV